MVLVENNPRIVVTPMGDAANSQTETKEAIGPLQQLPESLSTSNPRQKERFKADGNKLAAPANGDRHKQDSKLSDQTDSLSEAFSPANTQTQSASSAPNTTVDLEQHDWISAKAKTRRQILLVFFLSMSSCLLAILLFVLFIRVWGDKPTETVAQKSDDPQSQPVTTQPSATTPPTNPNNPNEANPEEPSTADPAIPADESDPNKNDPYATTKPPAEASPKEVNPEAVPSADPTMEDKKPIEAVASTPKPSANAQESPPLDAKPEPIKIADADSQPTKTGNTNQTETAPPLPESLRRLANVFDPSLEMRLGELPGSKLQAGVSTPDIAALPVMSSTRLHPPAASALDIPKKLAEEIAGIEITDRPIAEALELWSQLSGLGLEIRWNELAAVNVLPTTSISVKAARINYQDLLAAMVDPLGIEGIPLDQSLVRLAPREAKVNELLPRTWKVSDLITEKSPITELTRILGEIQPTLRENCQLEGDELVWDEKATAIQKFAMLETLEHLRVMRGQPILSSYAKDLFDRSWPSSVEQSAMTTVLTQPAIKNAPISQVLGQSAREVHATLSVDWSGTWEHGFAPYTEDTFLPRGRTLQGLAEAVAFKYGLEVAWLASNHVLLTTSPRLTRMEMMVHFNIGDQRDVESLKRRLSRFSTLSPQDLPFIRFAIDPESDMILAVIRPLRSSELGQRP